MELIPLLCLLSSWFGASSAQEIRPGVVNVPEGDDALLPCALSFRQKIDEFDWRKDNGEEEKKEVFEYERGFHYGNGRQGQNEQFKNRVDFFQNELETGNASITIKNTRLEDNGTYTCGLGLHKPQRQEFIIRLNVDGVLKIRNVTGAARVPYIQTIYDKMTWRLLECKAQGVPAPEVEWRNHYQKVLAKHVPKSEDGYSHVELQLKVNKSGIYTCVVTQREIFHQISNTLEVSIPDVSVSEGDDALLPCSLDSKENIESLKFSWRKDDKEIFSYDRGQVTEHEQFTQRLTLFQHELKSGNASIKILNTQKSDDGRYSCHFPNSQKSHVILQVVGKKSDPENVTGLIILAAVIPTVVLLLVLFAIAMVCHHYNLVPKRSANGKTPAPEQEHLNA